MNALRHGLIHFPGGAAATLGRGRAFAAMDGLRFGETEASDAARFGGCAIGRGPGIDAGTTESGFAGSGKEGGRLNASLGAVAGARSTPCRIDRPDFTSVPNAGV